MKKEDLILIGGGGHCHSCVDVIEAEGRYNIAGIIDVKERVGEEVLGYPIIGTDQDLKDLSSEYKNFFITIGQIKSSDYRQKLFLQLINLGCEVPKIISPLAHVAKTASIEKGTIVMHHAIVNANASIGVNCILNTKSLIEHDVVVGDHCHVSTASVLNGKVVVGNNVFIGSNTTVAHDVNINSNTVIGIGSLVLKDIKSEGIFYGTPVKESRHE